MYNMDWLNRNSNRRYPFKADATMMDVSRRNTISDAAFVDALIGTPIDFQFDYYISKLEYSPELIYIVVSCITGDVALFGSIQNPNEEEVNQVLFLEGKDALFGAYGKIIVGNLKGTAYGSYTFLQQDLVFEPCRIIKTGLGITSINGIKDGNITLRSSTNVVVTPDAAAKKITIDTFDGLCACSNCPTIKLVNGQPPVNNNIDITGIGCVVVTPSANGVQIRNDCEDACCGCDEVNDMVDRINDLQRRITILENTI